MKGYIYKITNNLDPLACHIGKTTYQNPQQRWRQHIKYAEDGNGGPRSIHQAFRKYGVKNFTFEILEEVQDTDSLEDREKYYINKYNAYYKSPNSHGYNLSKGGEGTHYADGINNLQEKIVEAYNQTHNEAQVTRRLQLSEKTVRKYLLFAGIQPKTAKEITIETMGKKVAILKDNEIVAIYPSLGEATRHFIDGESAAHISELCYHKPGRKTVKGYTAEFTDKDLYNENMMLSSLSAKIARTHGVPVGMYDIQTGQLIQIFSTMSEAGRYFKLDKPGSAANTIRRTIERDGTYKGYKWKYLNDAGMV